MANCMVCVFLRNSMNRSRGVEPLVLRLKSDQFGYWHAGWTCLSPEAELSIVIREVGQLCLHRLERLSRKSNPFQHRELPSVLSKWSVDKSIFPTAPGGGRECCAHHTKEETETTSHRMSLLEGPLGILLISRA